MTNLKETLMSELKEFKITENYILEGATEAFCMCEVALYTDGETYLIGEANGCPWFVGSQEDAEQYVIDYVSESNEL